MYRTCVFCNADLGANEAIEAFPVGRRLAFDADKGRLWVVCRRCERWNLTPLEVRWEAIEACERAFRGTTLRVSTDNIGLARVKEGLELVRIGRALRPEMAAWRYGDQFGRRLRRATLLGASGVAATLLTGSLGVKLGLISGGLYPTYQLSRMSLYYWTQRRLVHIPLPGREALRVRPVEIDSARLEAEGEFGWTLRIRAAPARRFAFAKGAEEVKLFGGDAIVAAGRILPFVNGGGARRRTVADSVQFLERAGSVERVFRLVARGLGDDAGFWSRDPDLLRLVPTAHRLALEMAANEDVERRALEGELRLLEAAWRDAEEVAKIADDMLLPAGIDERLEELRKSR